jgi:cell fate regulator YaaT (PSP1 superfamily)
MEPESQTPPASEKLLVGVQFRPAGSIHKFDAGHLAVGLGDKVVVQTEHGHRLGTVILDPRAARPDELGTAFPRVVKRADASDVERDDRTRLREREALRLCVQRIQGRQLPMKLVTAEQAPDGGKVVFYFAAEGRVDFRELVRELAHALHTRVEMKQIGARDEAQLIGAVGPCGRELCCSSWLRSPGGVSLKMAKAQGLSPHPSRLAGMCGRLKCCLRYEYDTYLELGRALPAIGSAVVSVKGDGVVTRQNLLRQTVVIRRTDGAEAEAALADLVEKKAQ